MLKINGLVLTVTDPATRAETEILHGNSFELAQGEALGLVGESGSGKSMTLKCILGIEPSGARVEGGIAPDGAHLLTASGAHLRRLRRPLEQRQRLADLLRDDPRDEAHPPAVVVHVDAAVQRAGIVLLGI